MTRVTSPLWRRLFDDAAVFPPGNAAFAAAVPAYVERVRTDLASYVGPFIAPAARWAEFCDALTGEPLEVSVTVAADRLGDLPVAADPRIVVRSVEVSPHRGAGTPTDGLADTVVALGRLLPAGVTGYLEVDLGAGFAAAAAMVLAAGYRIKIRTGGTTAEAFPTVDELADALATCVRLSLPFKLTAGLHNAIRHTDEHTGFEHHGFLNVIATVSAAVADEPEPTVLADILADTDPGRVAARVTVMPVDRMFRVRDLFTSFGTCSIDEPIGDLVALGLAEPGSIAQHTLGQRSIGQGANE